jgi:hypothetical protein
LLHVPQPNETPEPKARGTIFLGFRAAAEDVFGKAGLEAVRAALSAPARERTLGVVVANAMLPERDVLEWYQVVLDGPARGDDEAFRRFLRSMINHGFGRVRKALLVTLTPYQIMDRAAELWRHDHDTGTLECSHSPGVGVLTLRDHVYTQTRVSRLAIAEIYRHCGNLSRVKKVTETHGMQPDGSLRVVLTLQF